MRHVVAVPVVDPAPPLDLSRPLRPAAVRRAADQALQKMALAPELVRLLDGFLEDPRLSPRAVASVAGELLAAHGFTVGEDVPLHTFERVLAAAMRKRRRQLPARPRRARR